MRELRYLFRAAADELPREGVWVGDWAVLCAKFSNLESRSRSISHSAARAALSFSAFSHSVVFAHSNRSTSASSARCCAISPLSSWICFVPCSAAFSAIRSCSLCVTPLSTARDSSFSVPASCFSILTRSCVASCANSLATSASCTARSISLCFTCARSSTSRSAAVPFRASSSLSRWRSWAAVRPSATRSSSCRFAVAAASAACSHSSCACSSLSLACSFTRLNSRSHSCLLFPSSAARRSSSSLCRCFSCATRASCSRRVSSSRSWVSRRDVAIASSRWLRSSLSRAAAAASRSASCSSCCRRRASRVNLDSLRSCSRKSCCRNISWACAAACSFIFFCSCCSSRNRPAVSVYPSSVCRFSCSSLSFALLSCSSIWALSSSRVSSLSLRSSWRADWCESCISAICFWTDRSSASLSSTRRFSETNFRS
eukprot:Hpha_TRINITY_DN16527_c0_g4::TRINITY_DN16527_c0_g4_i1::g.135523::m.135523